MTIKKSKLCYYYFVPKNPAKFDFFSRELSEALYITFDGVKCSI